MLYPSSPIPDAPIQIEKHTNVLITSLPYGKEFRRKLGFREKRVFILTYKWRRYVDLEPIYNFYTEMEGALKDFIFEIPYEDRYVKEYIGTGDGVVTTFTLPFKIYTALTVYINNTVTTSYSINTSGERATITFSTAPSTGSLITCDFTGRARFKTRFSEEPFSITRERAGFVNLTVKLIEVLD